MMILADTWARPQGGSGEGAHWYYVGRGALAHQDWHMAQKAFLQAEAQLREDGEWPLVWLCLIGLTTLSWKADQGEMALDYLHKAHVLTDRLEGIRPQIWSTWLLGHLYAGQYEWSAAIDCFRMIDDAFDNYAEDSDLKLLRALAIVACVLCLGAEAQPEKHLDELFGLVNMSLQIGLQHGLPLEALQSLDTVPRLSTAKRKSLGERILGMLPRAASPPQPAPAAPASPEPIEMAAESLIIEANQPGVFDVRAYCFGRFECWIQHQLITNWNGGKSKTVFKLLLAAYPAMVPASKLMETMWPDVDEELARQRLHTAISDLRQALRANRPETEPMIVAQNGSYGLDQRLRVWIDIHTFGQTLHAGDQYQQLGRVDEAQTCFRKAIELYRGDFLEEDIYEDWPTNQREHLMNEYLSILTQLSKQSFDQQEYEASVRWGQLILKTDPCREDTHRLLMRCFSRLGQRPTAIRQYNQCVEALRRHLDAMPTGESEELYRRLQKGLEI